MAKQIVRVVWSPERKATKLQQKLMARLNLMIEKNLLEIVQPNGERVIRDMHGDIRPGAP